MDNHCLSESFLQPVDHEHSQAQICDLFENQPLSQHIWEQADSRRLSQHIWDPSESWQSSEDRELARDKPCFQELVDGWKSFLCPSDLKMTMLEELEEFDSVEEIDLLHETSPSTLMDCSDSHERNLCPIGSSESPVTDGMGWLEIVNFNESSYPGSRRHDTIWENGHARSLVSRDLTSSSGRSQLADQFHGLAQEMALLDVTVSACLLEQTLFNMEQQDTELLHASVRSNTYQDQSSLLAGVGSLQQQCYGLQAQIEEFIRHVGALGKRIDSDSQCSADHPSDQVHISCLPEEIILKILNYIPLRELCSGISMTCRSWYWLSHDPSLWQRIVVPPDTILEPHWLCYLISRSPTLKSLSLRGGNNVLKESLTVFTQFCPQLQEVNFGFCDVSTIMLKSLVAGCPLVSKVNFEGCSCVDSAWIHVLCQLKNLSDINISHCSTVMDEDIIYLSEHLTQLVSMNIDGNSFLTDRSVVALCDAHNDTLRSLQLDGAECTDVSVSHVTKCPELRLFTVSFAEQFTDAEICLLQKLKQLEHLQLRKSQLLSSAALFRLFQPSTHWLLAYLDLSECVNVDDCVVEAICSGCPYLFCLRLCWCWNITDKGVAAIVDKCQFLEHLDLMGIDQIEGDSLDLVPGKLPNLIFLNLAQCNKIKDDLVLEVLKRTPQLKAVDFYHEDFRERISDRE